MLGLALAHLFVADAEAFGHARAEVLDDHVGLSTSRQNTSSPSGRLEVEQHAALAAVDIVVEANAAFASRGIDLDDVGAELGERAPARRAGEDDAQIEHALCRRAVGADYPSRGPWREGPTAVRRARLESLSESALSAWAGAGCVVGIRRDGA